MKEKTYTLSEAAKLIGVHPKTLQRMDREGVLKANRTVTNRRYYHIKDITEFKRLKSIEAKMDLFEDIMEAVGRYHARMES